jgi:serine/threonine protein kinase/Tol biopolymer transport system component
MTLTAGTKLGRYEIRSPLGKGGMGEVYRAYDPKLNREVAIKVLFPTFSADKDQLARFAQEARATVALNHPNILSIYDVDTHDGSPYVVSELLEGETLQNRMNSAPLSSRKAVDYALQLAEGLATAHERGIVHRDLKPANIFITGDERVKILDFGLAKLNELSSDEQLGDALTLRVDTNPGTVMGTVGYMSPEQVRGQPVDHRSDIFSFGSVLYEMLSGKRAFRRESAVETLNAILKEEPPELPETTRAMAPPLDRIVRHCLEKKPEHRFQSTRDLAFDLKALAELSGAGTTQSIAATVRRRQSLWPLLVGGGILVALAITFLVGKRLGYSAGERTNSSASFHRLTFRRGMIWSARFAPDGQTIVYGAAWDGKPIELFTTRPDNPESRSLGFANADILAISSAGELALSLNNHSVGSFLNSGTLARMPLAGGAPRELLEDVQYADWSPNGKELAVVRTVAGKARLEFPIGKVLYETSGWIGFPRVSPKGNFVAFVDHPTTGINSGTIAVVDLNGGKKTLSEESSGIAGIAWTPNGDEVWFTGSMEGASHSLHAVTLAGEIRLIVRQAGSLKLQDISRDGRALLTREDVRRGIVCLPAGETQERDLSWLDWSYVADLSTDGKTLLFQESGEGGGPNYSVYLRKTDGSPPARLGDGTAESLSPDGKWAASIVAGKQLIIVPTGPGEPRTLNRDVIERYSTNSGNGWTPDGKQILFLGRETGRGFRLYRQDIEGGNPVPLTPEGVSAIPRSVTPDGKFVVGKSSSGKSGLYPLDGGEPKPIPGYDEGEFPMRWSPDGRMLYVYRRAELPPRVFRLDISTGRRELVKELMPPDPAGIYSIFPVLITPDGKYYAYTYRSLLADLYLATGLK